MVRRILNDGYTTLYMVYPIAIYMMIIKRIYLEFIAYCLIFFQEGEGRARQLILALAPGMRMIMSTYPTNERIPPKKISSSKKSNPKKYFPKNLS